LILQTSFNLILKREWPIYFQKVPDFCMTLAGPRQKPRIATYRRDRRPLQGSCQFHINSTIYWANTWKMKPIQIKTKVSEPKQYLPFYGPTQRGKMTKNRVHLTEQNTLAPSIWVIMWWNFTYIIMRHHGTTTNCICTPSTTNGEPFFWYTPPPRPIFNDFIEKQ